MLLPLIGVAMPAAALRADPAPASSQPAGAMPQTPGFHDLTTTVSLDGKPRQVLFSAYLPKGYDPSKRYPLIVFLHGGGARHAVHAANYEGGPLLALRTNKDLADWANFIVLTPVCPIDRRWEEPGVPDMVAQFVAWGTKTWAVDPDRVYITGLSMGGWGVWLTALAAPPHTFAAIAPFCASEAQPEKMPQAVGDAAVLIISGATDNPWVTDGSRHMYQALKARGCDVTWAEVPGLGHCLWDPYYDSRTFYQFLLDQKRGQKSTAPRPTIDEWIKIAYAPANTADKDLEEPLHKFLPWWYIANCGREHDPGLKDQALGRRNVLVTSPRSWGIPCRLMFTMNIPKDKKTTLHLIVAAHPQGCWDLIVSAGAKDIYKQTIGQPPTPGPAPASAPAAAEPKWVDITADLSPYAGEGVHLIPGPQIPYFERAVDRSGDGSTPVRRHRNRIDPTRVAGEGTQLAAGL